MARPGERELTTFAPAQPGPWTRATRATANGGDADLVTALIAELAGGDTGIAFVYHLLRRIVADLRLRDAAVVLESDGLGRQVFRAARDLSPDDERQLLDAPPGLYVAPDVDTAPLDSRALLQLCELAMRLDLLRYDAWHDPLTGLYDRRSFDRILERAISRTRRYGWRFTLVILDVDLFKTLNDREGHAAGDAALRDLGERFDRVLRFGDEVARIGGDEFALILPETDSRIVPELVRRVEDCGGGSRLSLSFGTATCPDEAAEFDELFRLADRRLYAAKSAS